MTLIRIIVDQPVRYSLNNGFSMTEYDPGVAYQVPPFVAAGMVSRGWAEVLTPADLAKLAQSEDKPAEKPAAAPKPDGDGDTKRKKER